METLILPEADYRLAVGERLRLLIDALGLSYVRAAELMGVSKSHLGNWMRGRNYPMHYPLYRFCRATGTSTDFIFLGDPSGLPARVAGALLSKAIAPAESQEPAQTGRERAKAEGVGR